MTKGKEIFAPYEMAWALSVFLFLLIFSLIVSSCFLIGYYKFDNPNLNQNLQTVEA